MSPTWGQGDWSLFLWSCSMYKCGILGYSESWAQRAVSWLYTISVYVPPRLDFSH